MSKLAVLGRVAGWSCVAIGAVQLVGGVRAEPGMNGDATVDSHVRFMGSAFVGYGLGWVEAAASATPNLQRMRALSALMALGGASRLVTRTTFGRPHRFHDVLLGVELAAPAIVEILGRLDRPAR